MLSAIFFASTPFLFAQSFLSAHTEAHTSPDLSVQPESEASVSIWAPLKPQKELAPFVPITPRQRLRWFLEYTVGPSHLAGGIFPAAFGTAFDRPMEYGPHWGGFGERYGIRMTGIAPQNAMEAGLGLVLGEDPRYFSARGLPFKARLANVIRLTFESRRGDGSYGPAFARYAAISGTNVLSNSWRVRSEANSQDTLVRTAGGFAGRMASNAVEEFWPSVKDHLFPRRGE
jgi:hypothetical protein